MTNVSRIEQALCRATGRRFAVLVGNGTAGLALCLEALGAAGRTVVLPDAVCINVPLAAMYAGAAPRYAEVSAMHLGVETRGLAPALQGAAALIAVHGHGSITDLAAQVPAFRHQALAERAQFLHRFNPARAPALWHALPTLGERVAQRWANLEALHALIEPLLGDGLQWLPPTPGAVPWRYNLLVSDGAPGHGARHALMRRLHAAGLHASSWHPPASDFLADQGAHHPVATRIGQQLLNLWIDDTCTPAYRTAVHRLVAEHRHAFA